MSAPETPDGEEAPTTGAQPTGGQQPPGARSPGTAAQPAGPSAGQAARGLLRARVLVVLASVLVVLSIMATWIRAQIIDTEGWTQTSVRLLQNEKVRELVSNDLSERLLSVVDVQNLAAEKLPKALQPLAPALSTAAAQVVPQAIDRALKVPAVQELWGRANHVTHEQVIDRS